MVYKNTDQEAFKDPVKTNCLSPKTVMNYSQLGCSFNFLDYFSRFVVSFILGDSGCCFGLRPKE